MRKSLVVLLSLSLSVLALGCDAETRVDDSSSAALSGPSFELLELADVWHFNLVAANQEVVLTSEAYKTRTAALNGMLSVLANAGFSSAYEVKPSADGEFYFVLKASNGQVLGVSETYTTKSSAKAGIAAIKKAAAAFSKIGNDTSGAGFERFQGEDGQFYFHLQAANGEIVLQSEGYKSAAAAWNGSILVVEALEAGRIETRAAVDGQVYFVVKAANGEVVAVSETYPTLAIANQSISSIATVVKTIKPLI